MLDPHRRRGFGRAFGTAVALAALGGGCIDRPVAPVIPVTQSAVPFDIRNDGVAQVDLLLEIDNSNSMQRNQDNINLQLRTLIETLTHPPDDNHDGRPDYTAVGDLHVGVISSDLGAIESGLPSCMPDRGDDGILRPIQRGPALERHRPTLTGCPDIGSGSGGAMPAFLTFRSDAPGVTPDENVTQFSNAFRCDASLGIGGCPFEQQLEAVYRALASGRADERAGNTDLNAGFLRERALLAIVILTDEEDGSVRDDAHSVYTAGATGWGGSAGARNGRFYLYDPGSAQDPTWPLERYVNPADLAAGFLSAKPGHPERIVFAAIAGVPLQLPTAGTGVNEHTDWDALLGAPDPTNRNNFSARRGDTALTAPDRDGHATSMRPNFPDPACATPDVRDVHPVVPACWRVAPGATAECASNATSYFALPSRRIVEIARRFDEEPLCQRDGRPAPCHNGLVTSVCAADYRDAMRLIVERIQRNLHIPCLHRALATREVDGQRSVTCVAVEHEPVGQACDAARGRRPALDADGNPRTETDADGVHALCEVLQVPTDATSGAPITSGAQSAGWYYDTQRDPRDATCLRRISFTPNADVPPGGNVRLECIQAVDGPEGPRQ